jgi:hypothetical protein
MEGFLHYRHHRHHLQYLLCQQYRCQLRHHYHHHLTRQYQQFH